MLKKKYSSHYDIKVILFSMVLMLLAFVQFHLMHSSIPSFDRFAWQFYFLIVSTSLLSIGLFYFQGLRKAGFVIKMLIFFLMAYPFGAYPWLGFTLLLSLLIESGLYFEFPGNLWGMISSLALFLILQRPKSAFYTELPAPLLHDFLTTVTYALMVLLLLALYTREQKNHREEAVLTRRLDDALSSMAKANLGFQTYSNSLELETLKKERKRVSREIHDTVGYSLTNIRIMLEAASMMIEDNPGESGKLIQKSMKEAGYCLEETRGAMRLLRSKEIGRPRGIRAFFQLVSVFAEATGIEVYTEFGNSPDSFGSVIDKAIFRFIQEGLTNSFRHGRASEIRIYFWVQNKTLRVSLQDNGLGAVSLNEGIGMAGMKERLDELKGSLDYHNISSGFEISISVPLSENQTPVEG
ncbi:sensor histidine kinase [Oceanispirochaeta crateris]|uniref:histidine kinase n=1 Tax=Oceanispirochaeta crateris TaxID=2518645 RepID=A0A5C1QPQ6_9SPIO|nr:sensor histidine kinase [Oceanispirochaeta crateris]QEN09457.1 sensor histidine kinase [Oceanispirochaeta crateris]